MTFYRYMMRNHRDHDTPEGRLAAMIEIDRERFPKNGPCKFTGWHSIIRNHLMSNGARGQSLAVFEGCWEEYVKCEKSKWSKSS